MEQNDLLSRIKELEENVRSFQEFRKTWRQILLLISEIQTEQIKILQGLQSQIKHTDQLIQNNFSQNPETSQNSPGSNG